MQIIARPPKVADKKGKNFNVYSHKKAIPQLIQRLQIRE
jgi:hypothetical protein